MKKIIFLALAILIVGAFTSCKKVSSPSVTSIEVTMYESTPESTSLKARGEIVSNGGAEVTEYGFCLSESENPSVENGVTVSVPGHIPEAQIFTSIFRKLEYRKTYHLRAYAINEGGVGYGTDIAIETVPLIGLQTKEATEITTSSARLNGLVNPGGINTKVWFEVFEKTNLSQAIRTIELGTFSDEQEIAVSAEIEDLELWHNYSFLIKAENSIHKISSTYADFETYAAVDIDGNFYHAVKIGNQIWMKENLQTTHYNDGTPIQNITDGDEWAAASSNPAYCDYDNNPEISKISGRLYNGAAVLTGKLAPAGWHVPNDEDWQQLLGFIGYDGGALKEAGTAHWPAPNTGATNSSGFSALPTGIRTFEGLFGYDYSSALRSATILPTYPNYLRVIALSYDEKEVTWTSFYPVEMGTGVRLIKDQP